MKPEQRTGSFRAAVFLYVSLLTVCCNELFPERTVGEKLYRKHCADCHGFDAKGNTVRFMGNDYADLTDDQWKHGFGAEATISVIRQELVFRHPSFDDLNNDDLQQITKHILQLRHDAAQEP